MAIHKVTMWVRNYATLYIIMVSQQASPSLQQLSSLPYSIEVPFSILQPALTRAFFFSLLSKISSSVQISAAPLKQQQTELENEHEFHDMQANWECSLLHVCIFRERITLALCVHSIAIDIVCLTFEFHYFYGLWNFCKNFSGEKSKIS